MQVVPRSPSALAHASVSVGICIHVHVCVCVCVCVCKSICIQGLGGACLCLGVCVYDFVFSSCFKSSYCCVQGQWFYALLTNLQKPLTPESCSWLRQLARICSILRATLVGPSADLVVVFGWMCVETDHQFSTAQCYQYTRAMIK